MQEAGDVRAAVNAAMTAEAAAVTFVGKARQRGANGELDLGPAIVRFLRASQCADEAHYHFFAAIGAVPLATDFSVPPGGLAGPAGFLQALIAVEEICVGAAMALARRFAELGDLRLVEIAYQIGAVDAQHQALARYFLEAVPASDRAFARWRFVDAAEAADALVEAGFLDGPGETVAFPGPVERLCEGVFGLVPETTDDVLNAPPPIIAPATPDAAPAATPAGTLQPDIEGGIAPEAEGDATPVP